jgi:phosphoesterase RecJ-like protein
MTTPHVASPSAAAHDSAAGIVDILKPGLRIALTTHVNADGDGVGSEVALWHVLTGLGLRAAIANPTPFPARFEFLMAGHEDVNRSASAARYLKRADLIMVLDISDLSRLGHLGRVVEECNVPVICIDHHLSNGTLPTGPRLIDAGASATGELVYHLMREAGWAFTPEIARALYVAILTDTGGFRFSNTTPGTLRVAADLLERGIDPEEIYRMVYASNPEGRVRLLGEVVQTLVVEKNIGLAWITVPEGALERHSLDPDQLEGVVELPRSIDGVRLALLFRTLANGRIKVSFRSVGDVNVAELAETFGGGGHRRASGASLEGTLAEVQNLVLAKAREVLQ